jgi:hypothetical protein
MKPHPHPASLHCPAAAQGWPGIESLLQQLPGQQFELAQGSDEQGMPVERRQGSSKAAAEAAAAAASGKRRRVLVMFIGGVTCAEVRFLSFVPVHGWHDGVWQALAVAQPGSAIHHWRGSLPFTRPPHSHLGCLLCGAGVGAAVPQPKGPVQLRLSCGYHRCLHRQQPAQQLAGTGWAAACGRSGGARGVAAPPAGRWHPLCRIASKTLHRMQWQWLCCEQKALFKQT